MDAHCHASQSAIGLLVHFKRVPDQAEAEQWLREIGGLKPVRDKAVKGRCRAALALLNPSDHNLISLQSDRKYKYFAQSRLRGYITRVNLVR
jgi:hypothetical protein